jgi:hypothetical protein
VGAVSFGTTLMIIALLLNNVSANAQDEEFSESLVFATTIAGVGIACTGDEKAVGKAAKIMADQLVVARPNLAERFTEAYFSLELLDVARSAIPILREENGSYFGTPCADYRISLNALINGKIQVFADSERFVSGPMEEESFDLEGLKSQLAEIDSLPTGQADYLEGCWKSTFGSGNIAFCLSESADNVEIVLTDRAKLCKLSEGIARKRGDGIFFYAFAEPPICNDGSPLQHIEAMCVEDDATLTCFGSVYSESNVLLAFEGDEEPILSRDTVFTRE